ncbi:hypothetical protein HMN09_00185100 [Mycena chlorophos]|uniref:Uncharacterized protein n=1 Tax=Mycena chlorophos TaxID=658473 RepID=A0A8H6TLC6_MYCCL|nr:hypothetical protein HMN09_00185100 [Mycena chlorophos]
MSSTNSLITWTITHLTDLYSRPDTPEPTGEAQPHVDLTTQLNTNLDASLAPDAELWLNHRRVSRAEFAEFLGKGRGLTKKGEVECKNEDCIESLVEEGKPEEGSVVAGTATIVHTHPWRIRAAPAKTRVVVVFSAKIQKNPEPQIVQLFHTWASKPFPIVMPHRQVDADAL